MRNEADKLVYEFGEVPINNTKLKWQLLTLHRNKNFFFLSKNLNRIRGGVGGFDDETRNKLKDINNINSIYDTCGFSPLFLTIEANSLDKVKEIIDFAIAKNIDIRPDNFSFTVGKNSVLKLLGIPLNNLTEIKQEHIILNFLDYLLTNENKVLSKYKHLKIEIENRINDLFNTLENMPIESIKDSELKKEFEYSKELFQDAKSILKNKYKDFILFRPLNEGKNSLILNFIFFRFPLDKFNDNKNHSQTIIKKLIEDPRVMDLYKIVGEYEYLIKLGVKNISELYSFLDERFHQNRIQTITKTVFRIWKEDNHSYNEPIFSEYPEPLNELEYNILSILYDSGRLLYLDAMTQSKSIRDIIGYRYGQFPDTNIIERILVDLRQREIYRCSAKLDRKSWLKVLIFIKASRGDKKTLESGIIRWLGASTKKIARKYFIVTGVFDFILLLDCPNIKDLQALMERLVEDNKYFIESIRIYPQLPSDVESRDSMGESDLIYNEEIVYLNSLLPNSSLQKSDIGEIPREIYYKYFLEKNCNVKSNKLNQFELFNHRLEPQGFIPTIEILPESMVRTLVRFKILEREGFDKALERIETSFRFIFKEYRPLHDINTAIFILSTPTFKSLFNFISELDKYSKNTEISLIFYQGLFKPQIPAKLKCHPCPSENLDFCDACIQYVKPRKNTDIRDVDCKFYQINPCKVAIIPMRSDENFKMKETSEKIKEWLFNAGKDHNFKETVRKKLREAIDKKASLIIFPELTIPRECINVIKEEMKRNGNKHIFIIAGSHYDEFGYNVCPILFVNKDGDIETRFQQKNRHAKHEKMTSGEGMLRFTNTGFGDFGVLICYDATHGNMVNSLLNKIDILIVPAWEHNYKRAHENLKHIASSKHCFIFFANNSIYGGSRFFTSFRDQYSKKLRKIEENKVECYDIDIIELDKARDLELWDKSEDNLTMNEKKIIRNYRTPDADVIARHRNLW